MLLPGCTCVGSPSSIERGSQRERLIPHATDGDREGNVSTQDPPISTSSSSGASSKAAVALGLAAAAVLLLVVLKTSGFDVQAAVKVTRASTRQT